MMFIFGMFCSLRIRIRVLWIQIRYTALDSTKHGSSSYNIVCIRELEKEKDALKTQNLELMSTLEQLKREHQEHQKQLAESNLLCEQHEKQLSVNKQLCEEQLNSLEECRRLCATQQEQLNDTEEQLNDTKELSAKHQELQEVLNQQKLQLEERELTGLQYLEQIKHLEQEICQEKIVQQNIKGEFETMKKESEDRISKLTEQNEINKEELNSSQTTVADLERDVKTLQSDIEDRNETIVQLKRDNGSLQGTIESIESRVSSNSGTGVLKFPSLVILPHPHFIILFPPEISVPFSHLIFL